MKVILINTPDGQYTLPLIKVAEKAAFQYYTDKKSDDFKKHYKYILNDDYEGIDWLINNTDYEDWEDQTTKINNDVKVTREDFWCSSDDFKIIDSCKLNDKRNN